MQQTRIKLPTGEDALVIYPSGKSLKEARYNQEKHEVRVHYLPPDDKMPDIAECSPSDDLLFMVRSAAESLPGF